MIDIGHFQLAIQARSVREHVPLIEARLREVVQGPLVRALQALDARALAAGTHSTDTSLVFIDRLTLCLAVNTTWSDDTLAQQLAHGVTTALVNTVNEAQPGVRRFDDRAAWLAQYLVARLSGDGVSPWWFDDLDGLRMLPLSAALRTVLCAPGDDGLTAATQLNAPLLSQLVHGLGEVEQARVIQGWLTRSSDVVTPVAQLLAAAAQMRTASHAELLYAGLALERSAPGAVNARSLRVMAGLSALLHHLQATVPSSLEVPADDLTQACEHAGIDNAWLAELNPTECQTLAVVLRAATPRSSSHADPMARDAMAGPPTRAARPASFSMRTPWGGVFVLVSVMHWRRWSVLAAQVLQAWPQLAPVVAELARALQHAVALQALLGQLDDHADRNAAELDHSMSLRSAQRDDALIGAFELGQASGLLQAHAAAASVVLRAWASDAAAAGDPQPGAAELDTADLDTLVRHTARAALAVLAARVPGCADASPAWLRSNLLASSAQLQFSSERGTLDVRLTRAPLHVLLWVAGLTSGRWPAGTGAGAASWQVNISTEDLA